MQYRVNNKIFTYTSEGEKHVGKNSVLLANAVDLTKSMSWHAQGYSVEPLFTNEIQSSFLQNTKQLLINTWRNTGLTINSNLNLDQYHTLLTTEEQHLNVINKTKLVSVKQFPIDIHLLEDRISSILQQPLKVHNPYDHLEVFHFRIIRPKSGDNNPLHRDVWLEDYEDCINLYIPITGSNENSSLIIASGSHLWSESKIERTVKGAIMNKQTFNVPAVTQIFGDVEFVRPNPQPNEVLIFSPYLIHGGAINTNQNSTRISIEIRLWKN